MYLKVKRIISNFAFQVLYKGYFKEFGNGSNIISPLSIQGIKNISLQDNVIVEYKSWLAALPLTGEKICKLQIGEGSRIGHYNHIFATKSIVIGKNVLTADKVYITDNLHSYENINVPIMNQPIKQMNSVEIGDGTWVGEHACIIGVRIGKNCVIGANSVVTHDIPDYCIVVGAPAKVIKRYNLETNSWEIID